MILPSRCPDRWISALHPSHRLIQFVLRWCSLIFFYHFSHPCICPNYYELEMITAPCHNHEKYTLFRDLQKIYKSFFLITSLQPISLFFKIDVFYTFPSDSDLIQYLIQHFTAPSAKLLLKLLYLYIHSSAYKLKKISLRFL